MLSLLLGMGFFSRQAWGWVSDRIGGLLTALISSALQGAAMTGFLVDAGRGRPVHGRDGVRRSASAR